MKTLPIICIYLFLIVGCSSDQLEPKVFIDKERMRTPQQLMEYHDEIFDALDFELYQQICTNNFSLAFHESDGTIKKYGLSFVGKLMEFAKGLDKVNNYRINEKLQNITPEKVIYESLAISEVTEDGNKEKTVSKEIYTLIKIDGYYFVDGVVNIDSGGRRN